MVGVADQLGSVKTYLGQVLGVFSVLRLGRRMLAWLRGQKAAGVDQVGWANEWSSGTSGLGRSGGPGPNGEKRPSSKPLILFLLSAVGLPYLMSRLVRLLILHQQEQQAALAQNHPDFVQSQANISQIQMADGTKIEPAKLPFARVKWEFNGSEEWELSLKKDEVVAVYEARNGATEGETGWWRGRTRDGRNGWFPGNYVEVIKPKQAPSGK